MFFFSSFFFWHRSLYFFFFFFSSRRRHTRWPRDWSSDVCSSDLASGTVAAFNTSSMRILHGMIGPKFQSGGGAFRAFLTVKGGADDFIFSSAPVTFSTFTSTVSGLRANSVVGVIYPGGGIEAYLGPIGLRLDVGDEIYFQSGHHNNLRITVGPSIRF